LATIVPPSTLFVIPAVVSEILNLPVKAPNFTAAETFVNFIVTDHGTRLVDPLPPTWSLVGYDSPIPQLSSLAFITTIGGDIVSIESPAPNGSYTLQFFGPSMQCDTANSTSIDILSPTMGNSFVAGTFYYPLGYTAVLNEQEQILVGWTNTYNGTQIQGVLCKLYNTSYTVHFNFTNTVQTINLLNRTIINSTAISTSSELYTDYLTAAVSTAKFDSSTSPAFQTFSYLGMLNAFANVIVGNVSATVNGFPATSSVLDTKLGFGPDLHSIFSPRSILFPNLTVKAGLEEMWFNFTISLFSADANVTTYNEYV
jgi:hypothetical protein